MSDTTRPAGDRYERLLELEDLESLAEEMDEIGVQDVAEVRRWLAQPRDSRAVGAPPAADTAALRSILVLMEELGIGDRATLHDRIRTLHLELDAGAPPPA